jgi:hypothetical protein
MIGPGDEMAAGAGRPRHLRTSYADREQVIDVLPGARRDRRHTAQTAAKARPNPGRTYRGVFGTTPKKDSVNSWLAARRAGVSAISTWPPPST